MFRKTQARSHNNHDDKTCYGYYLISVSGTNNDSSNVSPLTFEDVWKQYSSGSDPPLSYTDGKTAYRCFMLAGKNNLFPYSATV